MVVSKRWWVRGAGYIVGVIGGGAEGAVDGLAMAADSFTFGLIDPLHEHSEQLIRENGAEYWVARILVVVSREAALGALTVGTGHLARGGMAGAGLLPSAINAAAQSRNAVQGARYLIGAMSAYEVAQGAYTAGNGMYRVYDGDSGGWWDIGVGAFSASMGFVGAKDVNFYYDYGRGFRPLQGHHFVAQRAAAAGEARRVLARRGIDINDPVNLSIMPHLGSHPKDYYDRIDEIVRDIDRMAGKSDELFKSLFREQVGEYVRRDPNLLRKCGWPTQ